MGPGSNPGILGQTLCYGKETSQIGKTLWPLTSGGGEDEGRVKLGK